ncbi:fimbrial protein [Serratia sp. OS31]|uniref:fimbrial protein n=1 Tax=Serratia sp. OS31 TaxID=2760844 RepID=UPI001600D4A1|nr:fimbrial protein [Serratia sp. OS31]MBB1585009.1 fimbrial protein [Serratia sp. OS31]
MKKQIISLIMATVVSGATWVSAAQASDGSVHFTGEIIDTTCQVNEGLPNPLEVDLGKVARSSFKSTAGTTSGTHSFQIKLSGCPATLNSVQIRFEGMEDPANLDLLKLSPEAGVAEGVAIELLDGFSNTPIPMRETSTTIYPVTAGNATLNLAARYKSTVADVVAGKANATTDFTIIYP